MTSPESNRAKGRVVVAVDGSLSARRAVRFAASEAAVRKVPLRILTVLAWPVLQEIPAAEVSTIPWNRTEDIVRWTLDEAADLALEMAPALVVETAARCGLTVPALVTESATADLLVVGNRGRGGAKGLLLGSVAVDVIARALCPVAVVRMPTAQENRATDAPAPVVVGVDGGPHSAAVVEVAFAEAAVRRAPLLAVHTWTPAFILGRDQAAPFTYEHLDAPGDEFTHLDRILRPFRDRYPEVAVVQQVAERDAADAIVGAAHGAALVVVGSRGRGAVAGLVLGSVSQDVVHRAPCPVVVVPVRGPAQELPTTVAVPSMAGDRPLVLNI